MSHPPISLTGRHSLGKHGATGQKGDKEFDQSRYPRTGLNPANGTSFQHASGRSCYLPAPAANAAGRGNAAIGYAIVSNI